MNSKGKGTGEAGEVAGSLFNYLQVLMKPMPLLCNVLVKTL